MSLYEECPKCNNLSERKSYPKYVQYKDFLLDHEIHYYKCSNCNNKFSTIEAVHTNDILLEYRKKQFDESIKIHEVMLTIMHSEDDEVIRYNIFLIFEMYFNYCAYSYTLDYEQERLEYNLENHEFHTEEDARIICNLEERLEEVKNENKSNRFYFDVWNFVTTIRPEYKTFFDDLEEFDPERDYLRWQPWMLSA